MQQFKQWPTITPHGADASALEKPKGRHNQGALPAMDNIHYIESLLLLFRNRDGWSGSSNSFVFVYLARILVDLLTSHGGS
jgi:hypothetical protein